jgi:hypothetical protein
LWYCQDSYRKGHKNDIALFVDSAHHLSDYHFCTEDHYIFARIVGVYFLRLHYRVSSENWDVTAQDKKTNRDGKDIPEDIEGLYSGDRSMNAAVSFAKNNFD